MKKNTAKSHRAFVLATARIYVPGSLPEEAYEEAPRNPGDGCCGSLTCENRSNVRRKK